MAGRSIGDGVETVGSVITDPGGGGDDESERTQTLEEAAEWRSASTRLDPGSLATDLVATGADKPLAGWIWLLPTKEEVDKTENKMNFILFGLTCRSGRR